MVAGVYVGWTYLAMSGRLGADVPPPESALENVPAELRVGSPALEPPLTVRGADVPAQTSEPRVAALDPAEPPAATTSGEAALAEPEPLTSPDDSTSSTAWSEGDAAEATAEVAATSDRKTGGEVLAALAGRGEGGGQIYQPENTDARVIVHALDTSWVQVASPDGSYKWSRTLRAGDVVAVPNRADLELSTGNAAGIQVIVDGTALPSLGSTDVVLQGISLDPEKLLGGTEGQNEAPAPNSGVTL
jgi:hypothetical protein